MDDATKDLEAAADIVAAIGPPPDAPAFVEPLEPSPVDFPAVPSFDSVSDGPTSVELDEKIIARAAHLFPAGSKDTNPKDGLGALKLPLHLVPATLIALISVALHNGRGKYGAWNWRKAGVRASIYLDALRRHLSDWENGVEFDPADGVPSLAAAGACLAILVDAKAAGKLTDDRPPSVDVRAFFDSLTPHVTRLNAMHADKHPRHYTIADTEPEGGTS